MFKHLLRFSFRSLIRQKLYTSINIVGLAVGMFSFLMIMLYVRHEESFDSFHEDGDQIYRLISHTEARSAAITPYVWGKYLKEDLPEVLDYTTIRSHSLTVKRGDEVSLEELLFSADSTFFNVFQFPVVAGNERDFLKDPGKVVVTPELARRYFGDENPIGKFLDVDISGQFMPFEIQGVVECPDNSHLQFDMLFPVERFRRFAPNPGVYDHWRIHFVFTYLRMPEQIDLAKLKNDFSEFLLRHGGEQVQESYQPDLERLDYIYLNSKLDFDLTPRGDAANNRILIFVALGVLLMAVINFINISSAQSLRRAKEVGIRKVFGSRKDSLILQFISEAVLIAFLSAILSFLLAIAVISAFNNFTGKSFDALDVLTIGNITFMLLLSLAVGIISGSYPALILSSFKPIVVLRSRSAGKAKGALARKILVTLQFALSVVLILSTGVIYRQVAYMSEKNLGFNKEQTIAITNVGNVANSAQRTELFRQEMMKNNRILSVSASSTYLGQQPPSLRYIPDGYDGEETSSISTIFADHDYAKAYDLRLDQGRFFDRAISTDSGGLVINESAVRLFSTRDPSWLTEPLTKKMAWTSFGGNSGVSNVIGVVKDFNFQSLKKDVSPLVFKMEPQFFGSLQIKIAVDEVSETLSSMESTWRRLFPEIPFEYNFIDQQFARHFAQDQELGSILRLFALLSILVGVLGLFGLASFLAIEKEKEMSIRKVTGASEFEILRLLSWIFLKLVLVANIVALPVGFLIMNQWLNAFAFRINMPVGIFAGAAAISLLVTVFTVGYHSLKTARVNPARILSQD